MLNLLIFIVFGALWWAILWFGIAPDFVQWPREAMLSIHILPPVIAGMAWWIGRALIKRHKARQAEERKKKAEAQRQAALEEARTRHEQKLRQLRFACDCRLIAIADLAVHEECDLPADEHVLIQTVPAQEKALDLEAANVLNVLEPAIVQALRQVYQHFGAAAAFPIYIVPSSEISAIDLHHRLRAIHAQLIDELKLPIKLKAGMPSILHLPFSDSAAGSVIGLFDNTSDLPGAVVLAFDSPLSQHREVDPFESEPTSWDAPTDKLGHGVFALLMTHTELATMVKAVANHCDEDKPESLIPFWEKSAPPQGNLALLTLAPPSLREALVRQPPVACIHRPAFGQSGERQGHVLELERSLITLLKEAQIHAGLMDVPFNNQGDIETRQYTGEQASPQVTMPRCEWLVHNAGDLRRAASRMGAIANAMMHFQIELKPVEKGTSMMRHFGDLGRAASVGMLAIALMQARATAAPVLYAEFAGQDGVAVAFAVPEQAS